MASTRLEPRRVEKPWGRRDLGPWAPPVAPGAAPVGEIIFASPEGAPLLIKLLFTAAPLSVQVHPDAAYAAGMGLPHGKDEAWLILTAAVGATIGLGPKVPLSEPELTAAIADGSIAGRLARRSVTAGDLLFAPAGTIHTIGAGLALIEIQQNLDMTFRLHDYGRPRELHIDDGVAVAHRNPWTSPPPPRDLGDGRILLHAGPSFVVERLARADGITLAPPADRPVWVMVAGGSGSVDGQPFQPGETWLCDAAAEWQATAPLDLVLAYPGDGATAGLLA